jgi:hypothetical protein
MEKYNVNRANWKYKVSFRELVFRIMHEAVEDDVFARKLIKRVFSTLDVR